MPTLAELAWPKSTARLALRPMTAADHRALWEVRRLESVARWMGAWSQEWDPFRQVMQEDDRRASTLVIEYDGTVIGDLMLRIEDAWAQQEVKERAVARQAEIGWCLHPDHEGQGLATEAVGELIRIAFCDLGLRRVVAYAFAANEASWRLMERVGMRRETYAVADSLHRSGEWMDGVGYALLAEEWRRAHDVR